MVGGMCKPGETVSVGESASVGVRGAMVALGAAVGVGAAVGAGAVGVGVAQAERKNAEKTSSAVGSALRSEAE